MKKKLISCVIATFCLTGGMCIVLPTSSAFADTIQTTAATQSTTQNTDKSAATQEYAPTIKTAQTDYLVLQGSNFNIQQALKLQVQDKYDNDLASKIVVKPIPTNEALKYNLKLQVTDSKGYKAEKDITINVIGIKPEINLKNWGELNSYNLKDLIIGNSDGLTVSYKDVNQKANTVMVTITNGQNSVEKQVDVKLNAASAPVAGSNSNTNPVSSNISNSATPVSTTSSSAATNGGIVNSQTGGGSGTSTVIPDGVSLTKSPTSSTNTGNTSVVAAPAGTVKGANFSKTGGLSFIKGVVLSIAAALVLGKLYMVLRNKKRKTQVL